MAALPPLERILAQAVPGENGCLLYLGSPSQDYGTIWIGGGRRRKTHVVVWEAANGPVPEGWIVHHKCETKRCVLLAHLEALPHWNHNSMHHLKTHCKNGHEYTPENTAMRDGQRGRQKVCKRCLAASAKKYRAGKWHPCLGCGVLVSIRAKRCHSCHAKHFKLGGRRS